MHAVETKEIRCYKCNKKLGLAKGIVEMEIRCSKCKTINDIKIK